MKKTPAVITFFILSLIAFIFALQGRAGASRRLSSDSAATVQPAPAARLPHSSPGAVTSVRSSPASAQTSTTQIRVDGTYSQMVIPFVFNNEEYVMEREVAQKFSSDPAFMDTPFGERVNAVDLAPRLPKKRLILNIRNHSPQVESDVLMNIEVPKTILGAIRITPESKSMVVISRPARHPGHAADEFDLDLFSKVDFASTWTFKNPSIEADGTVSIPISLQQREALNTLSLHLKVEKDEASGEDVILEQSAEQLPSGLNYVVEMPASSSEGGVLKFNLNDSYEEKPGVYRLTPSFAAERGARYLNANSEQFKSDSILWNHN